MRFLLLITWLSFGAYAGTYDALDAQIRQEVKSGKAVGAAVAVVENGQIKFIKAYGVRKKGSKTPVTLDTVFQLGSVSKPITASLVAKLAQKKLLDFSTLSIRQYLSHTTGYHRAGWNSRIESGWPRERLLKELSQSPINGPGNYDYHNLAFSQIEEIVENATHLPFEAAIKQHLFIPFKMTQTTAGFDEFLQQKNRAWPHVKARRGLVASKNYSRFYHENVPSAAGINSSIRDMARFLTAAITDENLFFLSEPVAPAPNALHWFRRFKPKHLQSYYGYGWHLVDLNGERIVFHGGWVKGFINFLAYSPKTQKGIVILCNSETPIGFKAAIPFLQSSI